MKEWIKISDLLFFQEGPGVRNTQYTQSGVKLLNVANLVNGKVDLSTSDRYISEDEAYGRYKHFLCDDGDFIIASSGIKVEYFDRKMGFVDSSMLPLCMNTSTIRFKVIDSKRLNIKYFMYYLKSIHFKQQLSKFITGSAQLNFGPSHLKKMNMPLVSLKEQNDIVEKLSKVELLLDKYNGEIKLLDELIKARFVEMFGEIEDCDKWESKIWNEVVTIKNGRDYKKVLVSDGGYPVVGTGGEIARASKYLCPENTIVVGRKGSINNPMLMKEKFWNVDTAFGVIPNSDYLHYQYFYCFCKFYNFMKLNKATTLPSTTKADLLKIRINIPPLELQNQFASFVEEVDKSRLHEQLAVEYVKLLAKDL